MPGPPALTYLVGDGSQNFCEEAVNTPPPNDVPTLAFPISSDCRIFQQFNRASPDSFAFVPPLAGGSVWYQFLLEENDLNKIWIEPLDSLYFALYEEIPVNLIRPRLLTLHPHV